MTRPLFLLSLALLIVNDTLGKPLYPGLITGKLSDVAGLFAFVVFFAALVPRWRVAIGAVTAVTFIWWKSPASQFVVDALELHRTVDWTDLIALAVIPFACRYARDAQAPRWRPETVAIALLSLGAFVATSKMREQACCESQYAFPTTLPVLTAHLQQYGLTIETPGYWQVQLPLQLCGQPVIVRMPAPTERGREVDLKVATAIYACEEEDHDAAVWQALDQHLVKPLYGRRMDRRRDRVREWWRRMSG